MNSSIVIAVAMILNNEILIALYLFLHKGQVLFYCNYSDDVPAKKTKIVV